MNEQDIELLILKISAIEETLTRIAFAIEALVERTGLGSGS